MRGWPTRSSDERRRADDGDTLIEILIALLILSVTVVALVTAFSTSISASSEYRGLSVSDTVLRTVSEQAIAQFQQGSTYIDCPNGTPANYTSGYMGSTPLDNKTALLVPFPYATAGYTAAVTDVGYWTGSNFSDTWIQNQSNSCTPGSTVPEQITIQLSGPLTVPESISFVVEGSGQIFGAASVQLLPPTNIQVSTETNGDPGAIVISFTPSANATTYTVIACANSQMTVGCAHPNPAFTSGEEFSGLASGVTYYVEVSANGSPGYIGSAYSTPPVSGLSSGVASLPTVLDVTPSTTTAGALVVTFSPPTLAPGDDTYSAQACTNSAMTANCVSQSGFSSGSQITGLTPGSTYYVTVTANPDGTFPGATSLPFTPATMATVQLNAPAIVSVASSSIQTGALTVTFSAPSNAPATGQTYTVTGCTNAAMTAGCVSQSSYTSGSQFAGLASGSSYYVVVTANASTGYLASQSAVTSSSTEATVQLTQPVIKNVSTSKSVPGALRVQYTGSSNAPNNATYTLELCTNSAMTTGCVFDSNYSSNARETGLQSGVTYYITVTANAQAGYLASVPSAQATGVAS